MHEQIICRYCRTTIGPAHWQLFTHARCQPPVESLADEIRHERWQVEKTVNRALKVLDTLTRPHGRPWRPGHQRRR